MGIVFQNTGEQFFRTVQEELEYNIMKKYKIKNRKSEELSNRINEIAEIFEYDEKILIRICCTFRRREENAGTSSCSMSWAWNTFIGWTYRSTDYNMTIKFMKIVEKIEKEGTTVLLVTHC